MKDRRRRRQRREGVVLATAGTVDLLPFRRTCSSCYDTNVSLIVPATYQPDQPRHALELLHARLIPFEGVWSVRGYGYISRPEVSTRTCTTFWRCLDPGIRPRFLQHQGQLLYGDGADHEGIAECEALADVPRCPKGGQRVVAHNCVCVSFFFIGRVFAGFLERAR